MGYDDTYAKVKDYFGAEPEKIVRDHCHLLDKSRPVLDIGAGQGRHSLFLARQGLSVDAVDSSSVALHEISEAASRDNLPIHTYHCDFESFAPGAGQRRGLVHVNDTQSGISYSGVLLMGLMQVLSRNSLMRLVDKVNRWTAKGSLVFVTAFSDIDPFCVSTLWDRQFSHEAAQSGDWRVVGRNEFCDGRGHFMTYFEKDEILELFPEYKIIHHWEGMGPLHRHGDGKEHCHGLIHAVFQK